MIAPSRSINQLIVLITYNEAIHNLWSGYYTITLKKPFSFIHIMNQCSHFMISTPSWDFLSGSLKMYKYGLSRTLNSLSLFSSNFTTISQASLRSTKALTKNSTQLKLGHIHSYTAKWAAIIERHIAVSSRRAKNNCWNLSKELYAYLSYATYWLPAFYSRPGPLVRLGGSLGRARLTLSMV
jgi:hypothetical protein